MEENKIKASVLVFSLLLVLFGYLSKDSGIFANTLILSAFFSFSVFAFFEYRKYRERKEMEEKFPIFLHDLTQTLATGVPLHKAIKIVSKYDYGSLNKIVRPIANQISWNIPIIKIFDRFAEKTKDNKRISTAFRILKESQMSGGNLVSVLTSLSESLEMINQMEKERSSILRQYTVMIYAISFIFLGVVVMINKLLIPIFSNPQISGVGGILDPCSTCAGISCNVCNGLAFISYNFIGLKEGKPYYYVSIFFLLSFIQAIFGGLVAGQVAEGSVKAGIKHSIILTAIVIGAFLLLFRIGLIGV